MLPDDRAEVRQGEATFDLVAGFESFLVVRLSAPEVEIPEARPAAFGSQRHLPFWVALRSMLFSDDRLEGRRRA